jgi:hypothetical protein
VVFCLVRLTLPSLEPPGSTFSMRHCFPGRAWVMPSMTNGFPVRSHPSGEYVMRRTHEYMRLLSLLCLRTKVLPVIRSHSGAFSLAWSSPPRSGSCTDSRTDTSKGFRHVVKISTGKISERGKKDARQTPPEEPNMKPLFGRHFIPLISGQDKPALTTPAESSPTAPDTAHIIGCPGHCPLGLRKRAVGWAKAGALPTEKDW